jgi:hypothetical protein
MRRVLLVPILMFSCLSLGAPAAVQAAGGEHTATVCLSMDGALRAPACRRTSTWRQDDICNCPANTDQLQAPLCAPGETPAPEGAAADRARLDAAHHGGLMGANYQGKRFCVRPEPMPR